MLASTFGIPQYGSGGVEPTISYGNDYAGKYSVISEEQMNNIRQLVVYTRLNWCNQVADGFTYTLLVRQVAQNKDDVNSFRYYRFKQKQEDNLPSMFDILQQLKALVVESKRMQENHQRGLAI